MTIVRQHEGRAKIFGFLVFADESKFVKEKETGFLQFLPLCSYYICVLFDSLSVCRKRISLKLLAITAEYSYFGSLLYSYKERSMLVYSCCGPKANLLDLTHCFKHNESCIDFAQAGLKSICQRQSNQIFLTSDLSKAEDNLYKLQLLIAIPSPPNNK